MLELLTPAQSGRADQLAEQSGISGGALMQNAGRAVADRVSALFPDAERVAVLCGPGNNGGDGFVVAHELVERGYSVRLGLLGDPAKLPPDAAAAARRWQGAVEPLGAALLDGADVVVDGLFGAGLARPIEAAPAALIEALNKSGIPAVAIDIPSGIDGTTGAVRGIAVNALATVTFFRKKPGHLLLPGRLACGDVMLADIGIPESVLSEIEPKLYENGPGLWLGDFPFPAPGGHKYLRGHAVVVSGPADATGAARLAARGALRCGAGLVTLASPTDALAINASELTAIMIRPVDTAADLSALLSDTRKNAVVLGPGLGVGEKSRALVMAALASAAAAVVDADGLTSFAEKPEPLFEAVKARQAPVVFTPHEGEFARLFPDLGETAADPSLSKVDRARLAAKRSGAFIVLKGTDSVIAAPDGQAAINATSSPWLATAGTGDVLAGIVGGMLAQAMPRFESVCAAVWLHGAAGKAFGPGLIAEDVPECLPRVYRDLLEWKAQKTGYRS